MRRCCRCGTSVNAWRLPGARPEKAFWSLGCCEAGDVLRFLGPAGAGALQDTSTCSSSGEESCLHIDCGRGRGPRGILLSGSFMLLLLPSDEPVRWRAASAVG